MMRQEVDKREACAALRGKIGPLRVLDMVEVTSGATLCDDRAGRTGDRLMSMFAMSGADARARSGKHEQANVKNESGITGAGCGNTRAHTRGRRVRE